jgi:phosphoenolpyruvate carboxylase
MDTMQYFQEEYDSINKAISQVADLSIDSIKNYRQIITTQKDFITALIDALPEFNIDKIKLLFDDYVSELS